jgi:hypothetical protein
MNIRYNTVVVTAADNLSCPRQVTRDNRMQEIYVMWYCLPDYSDCSLAGCDILQSCRWMPTFRRNDQPLFSGSNWVG